jgi:RNA polymerase sigma-70 factor (ECF subfamily)
MPTGNPFNFMSLQSRRCRYAGKLFWNFWMVSSEFVTEARAGRPTSGCECKRDSAQPVIKRNPMIESDELLLRRMLQGDEEAFTALYRRRQGAVYRFALHMTNSVSAAEDITQEVFLALIENGRRFDATRGKVLSFLYGIARNHALRRIEKEWRIEPETVIEDYAGDEDMLGDVLRREAIDRVRRAIVALPPMYREAVVLCDIEDLPYEEAAAVLECPVGTVRSRLSRGRAMLAQKLARVAMRIVL